MVRRIIEKVPDKVLKNDLEKYRHRAIELGATDSKVITIDMVVIKEAVRAKCIFPLCNRYGSNANCPPCAPGLEFVREVVSGFRGFNLTKEKLSFSLGIGPVF